jgi:hypothetical protein
MGDGFDYAGGWYRRAYSPRNRIDKTPVVRDVQHQRCIFYVKGEYAIICDRVLGDGQHQVDIIFHPAPVMTGQGTQRTVRAVDLEIGPNGTAVTKEGDHANVAIIPAQRGADEVLDLIGQKDPVRGWFSLFGIQPSHDLVYRSHPELPVHRETVVQPLPAGESAPMSVTDLGAQSQDGAACAGLRCGDDLFLVSYDGPVEMQCGEVAYRGTALLLRHGADGCPSLAHMVDGERLVIANEQAFATDEPAAARSVHLEP